MNGSYGRSSRPRRDETAELASAQHGYVAGRHLVERGISRDLIRSWERAGVLKRRYQDVYAVGHVEKSLHADFKAATLAIGDDAALSHISGGVLVGMTRIRQPWIDVTVPRKLKDRDDIKVHFSRGFEPVVVAGIPVKAPLDLAIDLAECIRSDRLLLRALNQGLCDELYSWEQLLEQLEVARGRHGVKRVKRLLDRVTKTRSGLEDQAFADAVRSGARPLTNHKVHGREVDQYDAATNTVTEIDSDRYHGNPIAQYFDLVKQRFLESKGVGVTRRRQRGVSI